MKLKLNGKLKELEDGLTIKEILEKEEVENPEYVTVQLNGDFVKKEDYDSKKPENGDEIEFLYFMGGGK